MNSIFIRIALVLIISANLLMANYPKGDINQDLRVDILDLAILAQQWLQGPASPADIVKDADQRVNLADLALLLTNWNKQGLPIIVINEIHYDPSPETDLTEFIELYNPMNMAVDISGWYFDDGITYTFPAGTTIAADGYIIVGQSPLAMADKFNVDALGPYAGRLSNSGEKIVLKNNTGQIIDEVDYGTSFPWPIASDGDGSSMELINPWLDNDLGSSWRASGYGIEFTPEPQVTLLHAFSQWRYRKGTSEPEANWNQPGYADALWPFGQAGFGYNYASFNNTFFNDMRYNYLTIYLRKNFTLTAAQAASKNFELNVRVDDGCIIWINGQEVARLHVTDGPKFYNSSAINHGAEIETIILTNAAAYLVEGNNTIAVHILNQSISSSDLTFDMELKTLPQDPGAQYAPTPGARNKSYKDNAPPNIRQVKHNPQMPSTNENVVITAKVTDPDGVASVNLSYQLVLPGAYIPAYLPLPISVLNTAPNTARTANPAFENPANWITIPMTLTSNDIYSAIIPAQPNNRTLVRYRITVTDTLGNSVRTPFADDPSLNFAYYVYNGVPAYTASYRSVHPNGPGHTYPVEVMTKLPVYSLLARADDMRICVAYNSADRAIGTTAMSTFNWNGTMIYNDVVYDHIKYRLRQRNQRYGGAGKRPFRFRFNKGNYLQAHDRYGNEFPEKWRSLNFGKMCDTLLGHGNFGLTETMNNDLCNLVGVPAVNMFAVHFRVVDGPEEAPATTLGQYYGDFWGMFLGTEDYDSRFINSHNLPDGNMYKLRHGTYDGNEIKRNQGLYSTTGDEDFQNIRNNLRPDKSADWLNTYVDYDHWYRYNTICEFVRHRDYAPTDNWLKNRVWFFTVPDADHPYGQMRTFIHDSDASWGPTWASDADAKGDYPEEAIYADHPGNQGGYFYYDGVWPPKPDFKQEHRNTMRDIGDLVFQPEVINTMIDDLADIIAEFSKADRDRWKDGPADSGNQDWGPMENRVALMKQFALVGGVYSTQAGGRIAYIRDFANSEGDISSIPAKPTLTYIGAENYPVNDLEFSCSAFSDPQGNDTFAAMKWRIAEITHKYYPAHRPKLILEFADQTTTITTVKDAYVRGGWSANDNYGNEPELIIKNSPSINYSRRSYIHFDYSAYAGKTITRAYLTLVPLAIQANNMIIKASLIDDSAENWQQNTINFNNSPAASGLGVEFSSSDLIANMPVYIDVTDLLSQSINNNHQATFCLESVNIDDLFISFGSLESLHPDYDAAQPKKYEYTAVWQSEDITTFQPTLTFPAAAIKTGHTYRARVKFKDNTNKWGHWSDYIEFVAGEPGPTIYDNLRISELMYNPATAETEAEWLELQNVGAETINLNMVAFTTGISYQFGDIDLAPGAFIVLAKNIDLFNYYNPDFTGILAGPYDGMLSNGGEQIVLKDPAGNIICDFTYDDIWYPATDGAGFSLTVIDPAANNNLSDPANWKPSSNVGGSPGAADTGSVVMPGAIVINEVLAHSHNELSDWIELYNTTSQPVNIGNWFLSDNNSNDQALMKYQIPANTIIPADGYLIFIQNIHFLNFALSKHGEAVYLSNNLNGSPGPYRIGQSFGPSDSGISFGRHYIASTNNFDFVPMSNITPSTSNAAPLVGPIIINEICYHPAGNKDAEYVELLNISNETIELYDNNRQAGWKFTDDGGFEFYFPAGSSIAPGETILMIKNLTIFNNDYTAAPGTAIFQWGSGNLSNSGEKITLSRPGDANSSGIVQYYLVESVTYGDKAPWPTAADGDGPTLHRVNHNNYANDPANWQAAMPSPGKP